MIATTNADWTIEAWTDAGRVNHSFDVVVAEGYSGGSAGGGALVTPSGNSTDPRLASLQLSLTEGAGDWYEIRDLTAGESWWLSASDAQTQSGNGPVGAYFQPTNGTPWRVWMIVPGARVTHSLVLNQRDIYNTLVTYAVTIGGDVLAQPEHEAWATFDPTRPFWITDLNTKDRCPDGALDLSRSTWTPDYSLYPLVSISAFLEGRETGHKFTVHSRASDGPEMLQSVTAMGRLDAQSPASGGGWIYDAGGNYVEIPGGSSSLTFSLGQGMQFWITRDADNASSLGTSGGNPFIAEAYSSSAYYWRLYETFPDPPTRETQPVTFRVNAGRWGNSFSVWMSDGYRSRFGTPGTFDTENATYLMVYTSGVIDSWDGQSVTNPLSILTFSANIDSTKSWWLQDETTGESFSVSQSDVFDGWTPQSEPPPPPYPTISIHLPMWRSGASLSDLGSSGGTWAPSSQNSESTTFSGVDGMADFTIDGIFAQWSNPRPDEVGPYALWDGYESGSRLVYAGDNDLRLSVGSPQSLLLNVSSSRWNHELVLRHPEGTSYPIAKQSTQGDTSFDPSQNGWWNSYYYFDAATSYHPELPWYVQDVATGERLGPNPSNADLINWLYLATPNPVDAFAPTGFALEFTWTPVPLADSYRIERRQPFASGTAQQWSQVATVSAGWTPEYIDTGVVLDEIYAYRAIALKDAAESQPSEEAWAVRQSPPPPDPDPDSDGNGIPDSVEGTVDTDGDGFDDAHDPDNDNDGVLDVDDQWPNDPRRSEPIPPKYYGVIDLTPDTGSPVVLDSHTMPVIDDNNRVAWAGTTVDSYGNPVFRSSVWQNGNVTSHDSWPLSQVLSAGGSDYMVDTQLWGYGDGARARNCIAADGTVSGTYYWNVSDYLGGGQTGDSQGTYGTFKLSSTGFAMNPSWSMPLPDPNPDAIFMVSPGGQKLWLDVEEVTESDGVHRTTTLKLDEAVLDGPVAGTGPLYYPAAISSNGRAIWSKVISTGDPTPVAVETKMYSRPGRASDGEPAYVNTPLDWAFPISGCYALNDDGWAVGSQGYFEGPEPDSSNPFAPYGRGELGFVWDPSNGLRTFHDMLPQKYRSALRSVVPYGVSDRLGTSGVIQILATAETIGLASTDAWTPVVLIWTAAPGDSEPRLEFIKYTNDYSGGPTRTSANGDLVGVVTPGDSSGGADTIYSDVRLLPTGSPGRLVRVGFEPVGVQEASWGWDPPMDGDPPLGTAAAGADSIPDMSKKPVEWWTSIPAPTSATRPPVIAVVFGTATEAQSCELYVPKADGNSTKDIPNSTDLISIQHNPLSRRTPLKITAKATQRPSKIREANVWVIPKGTAIPANGDPDSSKILALLKVYVLPALQLPVSIWRVEDQVTSATLPDGIPSNADILAAMKDVLFQAGIEPYLDGGSDKTVNVRYDTMPKLGELLEGSLSTTSVEEDAIRFHPGLTDKKIRIFIVKSGTNAKGKYGRNGYANPLQRIAFIYADNFAGGGNDPTATMTDLKYSCAHELGHILGLSTRNRGTGYNDEHDSGRFPRIMVYNDLGEYDWQAAPVGLMQPYGTSGGTVRSWMRHEDWRKANDTAMRIISNLP